MENTKRRSNARNVRAKRNNAVKTKKNTRTIQPQTPKRNVRVIKNTARRTISPRSSSTRTALPKATGRASAQRAPAASASRTQKQIRRTANNAPKAAGTQRSRPQRTNIRPSAVPVRQPLKPKASVKPTPKRQPIRKPDKRKVPKQPVKKVPKQKAKKTERPKQKVFFAIANNIKRNSAVLALRVVLVFFVIIFIYLVRGGYKMLTNSSIMKYEINLGTIDTIKTAKAVIIRNETVYKAPADGVINYTAADNEKVKKGSTVCTIVDESAVKQREEDLEKINKKILDIQKVRDSSVFSQSIQNITSQIMTDIDKYSSDLASYNMNSLYELKGSIIKKLDARNQIFLNDSTGSAASLVNEKNAAEQEIDAHTTPVTALEGGIVSYYVDGLEDVFTEDKISSLTYEQTTMDNEKGSEFKSDVLKDENIFRIIESNIWYTAAYVDNEYMESWKNTSGDPVQNGDYVKVNIKSGDDEGIEVQGTVKVFEKGKQNTYVVLEISRNMLDFIDCRSVTLEINKEKKGYKITNTAIAEENLLKIPKEFVDENESSVTKKTGDATERLIISISDRSDDGKYIYTPLILGVLNSGDVLVKGNETYTITDELIVKKGVYMAHMGITQFIGINMEDSSSNASYTVISTEKNPSLTIYDKIISDAKSVSNEEKYY